MTETGLVDVVDDAQVSGASGWDRDHVMRTYSRQPVQFVRGEGSWLVGDDGRRYLDCLSGIAVCAVGHSHPRLVDAIQKQAAELIHVSNLYLTAPQARLARRLIELSDFERVFFCNSGAEANEAAIKLARKYGRSAGGDSKVQIVTAEKSFHGRTLAAVTATGQPKYSEPFAPLPPGFLHVPYNDPDALRAAVGAQTCAILLEPIQGEGGIHPADLGYMRLARELADQFGALLIVDEVQTGMGRTGKMWAYRHYGVLPDVMTLAKGLGGGVPIGACLARGVAAEVLQPGDHGSTFAGNPLATAAANAVLDILAEEGLVREAQRKGEALHAGIRRLGESFPELVGAPRGMGLMVGVAVRKPVARRIVARALEHGLVVNATSDDTLRLLPPLTITDAEIDEALVRLGRALADVEKEITDAV
jgi:acetylornithine/N-succinyldiaminopimelate aminotransferase